MGTQAILSIVKNDAVVMKVVTGMNGYNIAALKEWAEKNAGASPEQVYQAALSLHCGCEESLVVQHSPVEFVASTMIDELGPLYEQHFNNPEFNPRWERGDADYSEVVRW